MANFWPDPVRPDPVNTRTATIRFRYIYKPQLMYFTYSSKMASKTGKRFLFLLKNNKK